MPHEATRAAKARRELRPFQISVEVDAEAPGRGQRLESLEDMLGLTALGGSVAAWRAQATG